MTGEHFRNASWSGLAAAVRAGAGLLSALLAVRLLGAGSYGQIATWLSLFTVYLSLNSGVFTILVVRLVAAKDDFGPAGRDNAINAAVAFCTASLAILVVLTLLGGVYLSGTLFPQPRADDGSAWVVILMGCLTSMQILVAFQAAIVEGAGRLDLATKWQLTGPLAIMGGLAFGLLSGRHLAPAEYIGILCAGAVIDMSTLWGVRHVLGLQIPLRLRLRSGGDVFLLLRSSGVLQAATLLSLFLEPVNKFLLNSFVGPVSVATYDLAMKLIWGIQHLFGAAMRVFLHIGSRDSHAVSRMFARALVLLGGPVLMAHSAGALFLLWVVRHWIKADPSAVIPFFGIASISNLGMIFVTPLYLSLIGRRDLLFVLRTQAILAIVNVSVSAALIPWFGLMGSAFGLLVATVLNAASIYRRCRIDVTAYTSEGVNTARVKWRGGLAAGLLFASIIWGGLGDGRVLVPLLILVCLALLVPGEPLVRRIVNQFPLSRS